MACAPVYSYADLIVTGTIPTLTAYANETFQMAGQAATVLLDSAEIAPIPTGFNFSLQHLGNTFTAPPRPTRTVDQLALPEDAPEAFVSNDNIRVADVGPAPNEPRDIDYVYREPGDKPGPLTATAPTGEVQLDTVTMPDRPEDIQRMIDEITDPVLYPIEIPPVPTYRLDDIEFLGDRPNVEFGPPQLVFDYTVTPYSSSLLTTIGNRLSAMSEGGTGLPAAIEQALFDRARTREDMTAAKVVQEVMEECASRGFSEPTGVAMQKALEVRQGNQNAVNALNREIMIRVHEVEIENLRFCVTQGVAYEGMLIEMHNAEEERRFQAAKYLQEVLVSIFNSNVALHNSKVEAYKADAQIYRDELEGERTRVEAYRAQIEGQKVIGEINKDLVEMFIQKYRAVQARIDIYTAEVNGARAELEVNAQRVEVQRLQVQAYGARVQAYGTEWDAYKSRVEAALGHVRASEVAANNYATRAKVWGEKKNAAIEQAKIELAVEAQSLDAWKSDLQRWLGILQARVQTIGAQATALGADAQVYAAGGQIAQAESAAKDRVQALELERGRTAVQLYLQNAQIQINQALQIANLQIEAKRGYAQVISQLSSSVFAALNVGANISSTDSNSSSCNTSISE